MSSAASNATSAPTAAAGGPPVPLPAPPPPLASALAPTTPTGASGEASSRDAAAQAPPAAHRRSEKELLLALRPFTVEDRARGWAALASSLAVVAALGVGAALAPAWPLRLVLAVVEGLAIVRVFILFHDFQHGAILRGSALARGLFFLFGQAIFVPASVWRETHNYHHAHTAKLVGSHIGSFPMVTPAMYRAMRPGQRLLYRAARHPLNLLLAVVTVFALGMCLKPFLRAPTRHWAGLTSLLGVGAAAAAAVVTGHGATLVWVWLIPVSVACTAGAYLFYAQHNFPSVKVADRQGWTYAGAALDSSSYMPMGPLMAWFTGNIGYHHVHHLNAAIPFYRLPEAMAAVPELQSPGRTTLAPRDILACLRLKLYDPTSARMVGYER